MPSLVAGGPNLPIELLEAHAAEELVIFAGAGISVPAGLPDFKRLVEKAYEDLGEELVGEEARLFKKGEYDRVLELLAGEDRVGAAMRRAVVDELRTDADTTSVLHRALLAIAGAGNQGRLVTTNFDRLFLTNGAESGRIAVGPQLPVPRPAHWTGLIHLHGLIQDDDPAGRGLVLTSGDFGRAYLLDRWASRFVTELFQNFDVLFVGYGINDPVMRYLLDALAAERSKGGRYRKAFALAGIQGRKEERLRRRQEWQSKRIEPIFYDSRWRHRRLVETITAWAELARGGLRTRKSWVLGRADHPPSNQEDDDARFVVWALSESSGAVARAFATREPAPDIGWLRIFEESNELPDGLKLLELPSDESVPSSDGKPRPPPCPVVDGGWRTGRPARPSSVAWELCHWLTRHLDKEPLLEWVLRKGGVLHPFLRRRMQQELNDAVDLPAPYRSVWEVLASDAYSERKVAGQLSGHWRSLPELMVRSPIGRQELLRLITPVPTFVFRGADYRMRRFQDDPARSDEVADLEDLVEVKVDLAGGTSGEILIGQLAAEGTDEAVLRHLAGDLPAFLEEALRWQEFGGSADARWDHSHLYVPSIAPDPQNRHYEPWSRLIEVNRRLFELLDREDAEGARRLLASWASKDYPTFRRLVLHAATEGSSVGPSLGVEVLLAAGNWSLWNSSEQREVLRFLRRAGGRLGEEEVARLCSAILEGPPEDYFHRDMSPQDLEEAREELVWKRLARLDLSGAHLPSAARDFLDKVQATRDWSIPEDFKDEFPFWMEVRGGEPGARAAWRDRVKREPARCLIEVGRAARKGDWDRGRLRILLQEFGSSDYQRLLDRLRFSVLARMVREAPSEILGEILHAVAWWIQDQAARLPSRCDQEVLSLASYLLPTALAAPADLTGDRINRYLNHPAGQLVEAVLRRLWHRKPRPGDGIPPDIQRWLRQVMEANTPAGRLARLPLALNLMSLFLLDRAWCEASLLPMFKWEVSEEAPDFWKNYLRHPRFDPDLVAVLKPEFLELFDHLPELGSSRENAVRLLVFITVESPRSFSRREITAIARRLPEDDLAHAAEALASLLEHNEHPEDLWRETVHPWIERHWPSRRTARTARVSRSLAEVALRSDAAFPEAVEALQHRLVRYEDDHDRVGTLLEKMGFAERFPKATLAFLDMLVPDQLTKPWTWSSLRSLLDRVAAQKPDLREDDRYRRLDQIEQAAVLR